MLILEKAEDGEPFEPWDGSTSFDNQVSKSAEKLVRTAGANSNFSVGPLTLDQAIALHWRVRDWKLEVGMDGLNATGGSASVLMDGLLGSSITLFNSITEHKQLVATVEGASFRGYNTVPDSTKFFADDYVFDGDTEDVAEFDFEVLDLDESAEVLMGGMEVAKDAGGQYWLAGFLRIFTDFSCSAYGQKAFPSAISSTTYTNEDSDTPGAGFRSETQAIGSATKIYGAPDIFQVEIKLPGMSDHLVCPCLGTKLSSEEDGATVSFNPIRIRLTPEKYFTYGGLYDETTGEKV